MTTKLDAALEYLDRGWPIIPIRPDTKRPRVRWLPYQDRLPTEEEVSHWWSQYPDDDIAIITGAQAGVVVVDCDNQPALQSAYDTGMRSPVRVQTKRGYHLYFAHPRDGIRRGPRAGNNSRGADWPKINGLDFRGDGSYALLPPSKNYKWVYDAGADLDDLPTWQDWRPEIGETKAEFDFSTLDLSNVRTLSDYVSEWDRTAKYVREHFPSSLKIPTGMGNGRNERVMRHISDCVMEGLFGPDLRVRGAAFMREFFEEPLGEHEFEATCRSIEEAERRNHPERFDSEGNYIFQSVLTQPEEAAPQKKRPRLIRMGDAEHLAEIAGNRECLIEPWLPKQTIVQVFGYSGHGKSLFVQHAMAALAAGNREFGPFEIAAPARVLYLDFENGMSTLSKRLLDMRSIHGDTEDRMEIWTPYVEDKDMNLRTAEGLNDLQMWIEASQPNVVVIDTVRSAFVGLEENSASDWAQINTLALKLRNTGHAVIILHHSNKPQGDGTSGREAGSTNQLTVLETQIKITQVYNDKSAAETNAAIYDGDYEHPVWNQLETKAGRDMRLYMCMEVKYGKVREWTEEHDRVQWIGFAEDIKTGERCIVSSSSTKQRAKKVALNGVPPLTIAQELGKPMTVINDWLGLSAE